jgi:hypothetical protein
MKRRLYEAYNCCIERRMRYHSTQRWGKSLQIELDHFAVLFDNHNVILYLSELRCG